MNELGEAAWDGTKAGLERTWTEFKDAFSNVSGTFK
jgi:hypothetical protein